MADYIYPNNTLEDGSVLLELLGSFWNGLYDGFDQINAYATALGKLYMQTYTDLNEVIASTGRHTIPVFHTYNWRPLTLLNSKKQLGSVIKFGQANLIFGYQPNGIEYVFGVEPNTTARFPLPTDITGIPIICDSISNPTITLLNNIDYTVDASTNYISFRTDPFNNSLIQPQAILDANGNQVDSQITLWMAKSTSEQKTISQQLGSFLGIYYPSSQRYLDFINAVLDSITGGTSIATLSNALVAISDIPLTLTDGEVVQYIETDNSHLLIITNVNTYKFNAAATPIVTVGSVVNAGDPLVGALKIYADGAIPTTSDISQLVIPPNYFTIQLSGNLTFVNSLQNTTVGTDGSGNTTITFPITGAASDISAFWNAVDVNGVAAGTTLAELLDTRKIKVGQPGASNLPAQINPLAFLIQNVFRNNMIIVKMVTSQFGENALGTSALTYLRKIVPSNMALFVVLE